MIDRFASSDPFVQNCDKYALTPRADNNENILSTAQISQKLGVLIPSLQSDGVQVGTGVYLALVLIYFQT